MNDRNMGKIGTMSQSNPVTAHGIFNSIILIVNIVYNFRRWGYNSITLGAERD